MFYRDSQLTPLTRNVTVKATGQYRQDRLLLATRDKVPFGAKHCYGRPKKGARLHPPPVSVYSFPRHKADQQPCL